MTIRSQARPIEILFVEDNPGDVLLVRKALEKSPIRHRLQVAGDGEEATRYLRRLGEYAQRPRPDLILLDLNLPGKNGHDLLADIKADRELCRIPIVVLSGSELPADILDCYALHANCYVTKPFDVDRFVEVVRAIAEFWLTVATLPMDT